MPQAPKLSAVQTIALALVTVFLVLTWSFGGLGGYTTGVGTTLTWFVAIFVAVDQAFERYLLNPSQLGNFRFGGAIAVIFVFALIPVSWYPLYCISISAILGPLTVLAFVLYGVYLTYESKELKQDGDKKERAHKTHSFFLMLRNLDLSFNGLGPFGWHFLSALPICLTP